MSKNRLFRNGLAIVAYFNCASLCTSTLIGCIAYKSCISWTCFKGNTFVSNILYVPKPIQTKMFGCDHMLLLIKLNHSCNHTSFDKNFWRKWWSSQLHSPLKCFWLCNFYLVFPSYRRLTFTICLWNTRVGDTKTSVVLSLSSCRSARSI